MMIRMNETLTTPSQHTITAATHNLIVSILVGMSDAELIATTSNPSSAAYALLTAEEHAFAMEQLRLRAPQTIEERRRRRTRNAAVDAATRAAKYIRACLLGGQLAATRRRHLTVVP